MKKKIFVIMIMLIILLTGCSGEKRNGTGVYSDEYLIQIGFIQGGPNSGWKREQSDDFKNTFVNANGYKFFYKDCGEDYEKQIEAMREMIDQGVEYLIVNPIEAYGWERVLKKASEKGCSVIIINNKIEDVDSSLYECQVGVDVGAQLSEIEDWLNRENRFGRPLEKKEIAYLQGEIGDSKQMESALKLEKMLNDNENWQIDAQISASNSRQIAKEYSLSFLEEFPGLNVIIAEDDNMALGAVSAAKEYENKYEKQIHVDVISLSDSKEVLEEMKKGEIQVAFENSPYQAKKCAELIQKIEVGIHVDQEQTVSGEMILASDVTDEMIADKRY